MSKLALNSFYGKFGQRTNMKKTVFVKDIKTLMQILTDPSKQQVDYHIMNDDVIQVEYKNNNNNTLFSLCYKLRLSYFVATCNINSRLLQ